jgi:hypothetical protein
LSPGEETARLSLPELALHLPGRGRQEIERAALGPAAAQRNLSIVAAGRICPR